MGMKAYLSTEQRKQNRRDAVRRHRLMFPEKDRERQRRWRERNREKYLERARRWKAANPEKVKASFKRWRSKPENRIRTLVIGRVWDAKKSGIPFDEAALMELAENPAVKCAVGGCVLDYDNGARSNYSAPSIDKVVPQRGYVRGNIAVVCRLHNTIKGGASAAEHRLIADYIQRHDDAFGK